MNHQMLQNALRGLPLSAIHYFEETDSTNERALGMVRNGAAEFTLLIADRQTAGRGRMGRRWITEPGASLAFSLILHPSQEEQMKLGLFSFLGALSVCEAIKENCRASAQVKWPNDILLGGEKTAGILAESVWSGSELQGLVLGIGINLLPSAIPSEKELMFPATCVQEHCSQPVNRLLFFRAVLAQIFKMREFLTERKFIRFYEEQLAYINETVLLTNLNGESITGRMKGIDEEGQLVLIMDDEKEQAFPIGDLRLRPI